MGFEITTSLSGSVLRVFIDYDLPQTIPARWLGRMFGRYYGRWCIRKMASDAAAQLTAVQVAW
mgnify:CR=1 FL=1|jgi:hypothetical protein